MSTSDYFSNPDNFPYLGTKGSPHNFGFSSTTKFRSPRQEDETENKYQYLRNWYEARVRELKDDIRQAFKLIQKDALIDTMRQDSASEEYINQRVTEIIEDCISNHRETALEKLALQCGYLKTEFSRSEQEHIKV